MTSEPVPRANDTPPPLLEMRGIRKSFAGIEVLRGVDFELRRGEVHTLVGENGAGKTTLIKILAGAHRDHAGEIRIAGTARQFSGPRDAEDHGIAVIHQELSLIAYLSVAENIFLGREPVTRLGWLDTARACRSAAEILHARLGLDIDVTRRVAELPISVQQLVEIAKALSRDANIVVMDEPTSALSDTETQRLFTIINQLRGRGVGVIYISHRMEEIYQLADRITVLRDGRHVVTSTPDRLPQAGLVRAMVGRTIQHFIPKKIAPRGAEILRVEDLTLLDRAGERPLVRGVGLRLHAGEIVGLAGLVGAGNSELLGAIFGRFGRPQRGTIRLAGRAIRNPAPRTALRDGVALLTNDRQASGLILPMSVLGNLTLSSLGRCRTAGMLDAGTERRLAAPWTRRLSLRAASMEAEVATLSGGNQQKVVFARWLLTEPRVLLLDEPTRGVDVAAKADIYALLNELTAAGLGILLITSELPELLALSDRILVMHRGAVTAELSRGEADQERIMRAAMGG